MTTDWEAFDDEDVETLPDNYEPTGPSGDKPWFKIFIYFLCCLALAWMIYDGTYNLETKKLEKHEAARSEKPHTETFYARTKDAVLIRIEIELKGNLTWERRKEWEANMELRTFFMSIFFKEINNHKSKKFFHEWSKRYGIAQVTIIPANISLP
jgi:hypothetical protein